MRWVRTMKCRSTSACCTPRTSVRIALSGRWPPSRRWLAASEYPCSSAMAGAQDATIKALPQGFWSSFGYMSHDAMAALPNSLLTITLASNFGTFLLYMLSCVICMVGYHGHPNFNSVKHFFIPLFGLLANLACMVFYLVGPFMGYRHPRNRCGLWDCDRLGHLRRHLLPPLEQVQRPYDAGRTTSLRGRPVEALRRLLFMMRSGRLLSPPFFLNLYGRYQPTPR